MTTSILAMPKPTVQLPVMTLAIIMVSVVARVLHVKVFTRLRVLFACPVPGMCSAMNSAGIHYG